MNPNDRYDIKTCTAHKHLFSLKNGFMLVRTYNPKSKEQKDSWFCLDHALNMIYVMRMTLYKEDIDNEHTNNNEQDLV